MKNHKEDLTLSGENNLSVLIIEPHMTGHHSYYLTWIISLFLQEGYAVNLGLLEESKKHPVTNELIENFKGRVNVVISNSIVDSGKVGFLNLIKKNFVYYKLFKEFYSRLAADQKIDLIFSPYIDNCIYAISILGSPFGKTPWSGIVMRPSFHYEKMSIVPKGNHSDYIKELLFIKVLGNKCLNRIYTIDNALYKYISDGKSKYFDKLVLIPDPVETYECTNKREARTWFNLPKDVPILLVFGALSLRKGIAELLNSSDQEAFPKDLHMLFVGEQDPDVSQVMNSKIALKLISSKRLHQINRRVTNQEEAMVFSLSDLIWVGYSGHKQMSGVLVQAGMMSKPVIACDEGLIGWLTKQSNSGEVVDISLSSSITNGLKRILSSESNYSDYAENAYKFYSSYTIKNTQDIIADDIQQL